MKSRKQPFRARARARDFMLLCFRMRASERERPYFSLHPLTLPVHLLPSFFLSFSLFRSFSPFSYSYPSPRALFLSFSLSGHFEITTLVDTRVITGERNPSAFSFSADIPSALYRE